MTNKEKILEIASTLCRNSQAEMSRRLGLSQTAVNTWLKRGTIDYEKISETFPEVSAEWLLRGEGSMLKTQPTQIHNTVNGTGDAVSGTKIQTDSPAIAEEIQALRKELEALRTQNFKLTNQLLVLMARK